MFLNNDYEAFQAAEALKKSHTLYESRVSHRFGCRWE